MSDPKQPMLPHDADQWESNWADLPHLDGEPLDDLQAVSPFFSAVVFAFYLSCALFALLLLIAVAMHYIRADARATSCSTCSKSIAGRVLDGR